MKVTFTRIYQLIILLAFPVFVVAQKDYNVLLHSGKFVPAENISSISNNDAIMQSSLYQDKFYILIQFRALPGQPTKDRLKNAGIELIDYIPNLSYTAAVNKNTDISILKTFPVRSIYRFENIQKTVPALMRNEVPYYAIKQAGYADLFIITYEKLAAPGISSSISALGGSILEDMPSFRTFTIRIPFANIQNLISMPFVQWAEPIDPPNELENLPGRTLHRVNILNDGVRNLKGDGINVGIWDEGEIGAHLDFSPAGRVTQVENSSPSLHSTHCAGTILGKGLINPIARGMAPNANLYSYNFSGNIQNEMAAGIPANNLVVSSHSYGSTQTCGLN
ncbi:MAG TPA: S8 family serine peptidase, partial [Chitinophagaceae bacterium]|nr:S8 family serine peptidase [Chitinophagaceae bacterium]